jgi:hypothetical protein
MPTRPDSGFWQDGAAPFLFPGLNDDRETLMDYSEALSSETDLNTQASDYTLALADKGKAVEINSATAATVTVPAEADVDFPVGSYVEVDQMGAGQVTIEAGVGVTILSSGDLTSLRGQYSTAVLRKRASDEWLLVGDLAEAS